MATKIDLDELEAATMSAPGRTSRNTVTLALIAHIRDLRRCIERLMVYAELDNQRRPQWNGNRFDDEQLAKRLLEDGPVLP